MTFQINDSVICIHGPFEGLGIVIGNNNINKVLVAYLKDSEIHHIWCKYEWLEKKDLK